MSSKSLPTQFTRFSGALQIPLDELIVRLGRRETIDGIMVVGSLARDQLTPASDYDLVIVASEMAALVDMGHTIVDGRHTDLRFLAVQELIDMIEFDGPVNPYTPNGRTLLRMGDGRIEKDDSGCLSRARQKVLNGVDLELLNDRQKYDRWWFMNMFLRIAGRLDRSDDPIYVQAADMHVNGILDHLMIDYFNFRGLLWKGEKDAVRHWNSQDPGFLLLFKQCLKEADTSRRVALLRPLCALASKPFGAIWGDDQTAMHVRMDGESALDVAQSTETALDMWDALVGRTEAYGGPCKAQE